MSELWATSDDLTAKARIRNAALELLATQGEGNTTMRAVAQVAGVTPGLVIHHFGNKDGLRHAVERLVIERFQSALLAVPLNGSAAQVGPARDASIARMLSEHPVLVDYVRRAMLDPQTGPELLERMMDFTLEQVRELRAAGVATSTASETTQAISILFRQLGHLLLQPMLQHMWTYAGNAGPGDEQPPVVEVKLRPRH